MDYPRLHSLVALFFSQYEMIQLIIHKSGLQQNIYIYRILYVFTFFVLEKLVFIAYT